MWRHLCKKTGSGIFIILLFFCLLFPGRAVQGNPYVNTAFPDAFERDDTPAQAGGFDLNAISCQIHNFHKENDADWVRFTVLKEIDAVEIKTYDPGENCETIISLYDRDGINLIREDRSTLSNGIHLVSWRPPANGTYYVKITNKKSLNFGSGSTYKLWIYVPVMPYDAYLYGEVTNIATGQLLEGSIVKTDYNISASKADGFFVLPCPPGEIIVCAEKEGFKPFSTEVTVNELQHIELNIPLSPLNTYSSTYDMVQWGTRGGDAYYCLDICNKEGVPFPGLQPAVCGENLNTWSPREFINITLGVPDSQLSGFQFMWKIWSRSGYGGEGFEGTVTIP